MVLLHFLIGYNLIIDDILDGGERKTDHFSSIEGNKDTELFSTDEPSRFDFLGKRKTDALAKWLLFYWGSEAFNRYRFYLYIDISTSILTTPGPL